MEKGGVEDRDMGDVGQDFPRDRDAIEVGRVVQRGQRNKVPNQADDLVVDKDGAVKQAPAVDHAVPAGHQVQCGQPDAE